MSHCPPILYPYHFNRVGVNYPTVAGHAYLTQLSRRTESRWKRLRAVHRSSSTSRRFSRRSPPLFARGQPRDLVRIVIVRAVLFCDRDRPVCLLLMLR